MTNHQLPVTNHSAFTPRSILVTGGAGFIGCNFVRYMLETDQNVRIVNLDVLTYAGSLDSLKDLPDKVNVDQVDCETREYPLEHESRHVFIQGDICDRSLVEKLLREHEIDTIVHFAAESHVDNSIAGPEIFIQTNVMGTFTLLDAARNYWLEEGALTSHESLGECHEGQRISPGGQGTIHQRFRFHHISTDEVYGTLGADDPAFSETTPYAPNSPYSASKAGSDHLVRAYFHTYGLPVTTTNCSNNYGPYQHGEKFIPTVIRACLENKPIPVYGDGSNIRDWLFVTDHCSGIDAVIRKGEPGEVYNIGGINEWANIDICRLICKLMDEFHPLDSKSLGECHEGQRISSGGQVTSHQSLITFVKDRPGHDWRYAIDAEKMGTELGWKPAETFETGIRKTVMWYLKLLKELK